MVTTMQSQKSQPLTDINHISSIFEPSKFDLPYPTKPHLYHYASLHTPSLHFLLSLCIQHIKNITTGKNFPILLFILQFNSQIIFLLFSAEGFFGHILLYGYGLPSFCPLQNLLVVLMSKIYRI